MKKDEINIRDPFVVYENGLYYMYGTRAKNFGVRTGGFDVYVSKDLNEWSEPIECFDSAKHELNDGVNWAPEVHKYNDKYYMFASFTAKNGLHATYSLVSDTLTGPFKPNSNGPLTPDGWECIDGTLYVDEQGIPYLVFCCEHTQITNGKICYLRLNENLDSAVGDAVTLFKASECEWVDPIRDDHYVTDGPFMYRANSGDLFMIWSSFIGGKYAELIVKFKDGKFGTEFEHLKPMLDSDGGHGMIFSDEKNTYFTYHTPNTKLSERPEFCIAEYTGKTLSIK